jgi:tetratricopeptide (TPR) repeat protein
MEWQHANAIPIEAQYLYRKAMELSRQGQTGTALNFLRQAVVIAPRYSKAYYEMGNCLARLGQYSEAYEKYRWATHIDPASTEPRQKMEELESAQDSGRIT